MHNVIIVRSGAVGCVLVNRLTAEKDRKVHLPEAAHSYPDLATTPSDMAKIHPGPMIGDKKQ